MVPGNLSHFLASLQSLPSYSHALTKLTLLLLGECLLRKCLLKVFLRVFLLKALMFRILSQISFGTNAITESVDISALLQRKLVAKGVARLLC